MAASAGPVVAQPHPPAVAPEAPPASAPPDVPASLPPGLDESVTVTQTLVVPVMFPLAPWIWTSFVPRVAVLAAVKVAVLGDDPEVEAGAKATLTPLGAPEALRETLPVKPPSASTDTLAVALPPRRTMMLAGEGDSENPAAPPEDFTVRATVVDLLMLGLELVPTIVTVALPAGAVDKALKVTVLLPEVDGGLKLAETPSGRFWALSETLPEKPPEAFTVMVEVPVAPRSMETLAGEAESEKLGDPVAFTVSSSVFVWLRPPEVPVMVTVAVPVVAEDEAPSVRVLWLSVEVGEKVAVTPLGNPVAFKVTAPLKPPDLPMRTVAIPLSPWFSVRADGLTTSSKLPMGVGVGVGVGFAVGTGVGVGTTLPPGISG